MSRLRSVSPVVVDWVLAGALTVYVEIDVWLRSGVVPGPRVLGAVGLALMTLPLAFRRTRPLASACVSMAALAAQSAAAGGAPEGAAVLLPVLVVLYSVAAYEDLPRALVGAG